LGAYIPTGTKAPGKISPEPKAPKGSPPPENLQGHQRKYSIGASHQKEDNAPPTEGPQKDPRGDTPLKGPKYWTVPKLGILPLSKRHWIWDTPR